MGKCPHPHPVTPKDTVQKAPKPCLFSSFFAHQTSKTYLHISKSSPASFPVPYWNYTAFSTRDPLLTRLTRATPTWSHQEFVLDIWIGASLWSPAYLFLGSLKTHHTRPFSEPTHNLAPEAITHGLPNPHLTVHGKGWAMLVYLSHLYKLAVS